MRLEVKKVMENDRVKLLTKRRACELALNKATNDRVKNYETLRLADIDKQLTQLDEIEEKLSADA